MHRMLYVVVAALVGIGLGWQADAAGIDAAKAAAAKRAADQFMALAAASSRSGSLPRQSDPAVKALLDTVFDPTALGSATLPLSESTSVMNLFTNANRVGVAYLLAGTGATDLAEVARDPKLLAAANRNTVTFAPEIGRWLDYQIWVQNAFAGMALDFFGSATADALAKPNAQHGLNDVRSGLKRSISGLIGTMSMPGLSDGWRLQRLPPLLALAPKAARLLLPADAADVQHQMTELAGSVQSPVLQLALKRAVQLLAPAAPR